MIGDVFGKLSQDSAKIAPSASEISSMQHQKITRNGRFPYWKIDHIKQCKPCEGFVPFFEIDQNSAKYCKRQMLVEHML